MIVHVLSSSYLLSKTVKLKVYRTVIIPFVLCGCETWSLTLKKNTNYKCWEKIVLRKIFVPKRNTISRFRIFYNEELHVLFS